MEYEVQFPDPNTVDDEGLVAVGGELSEEFLISAYRQGLFPWFDDDSPIMWWSPNPRLVLYPQDFKVSKSLKQVIRSNRFSIKIDENFDAVIRNCANIKRDFQYGTWITNDMIDAYNNLHRKGFAHSFETYRDGELVGGLYGISLGRAFFGESMFHKQTDASKFALYHLVEWCKHNGFYFIDAQQSTNHLISLGAKEISRSSFLQQLKDALQHQSIIGKWEIAL